MKKVLSFICLLTIIFTITSCDKDVKEFNDIQISYSTDSTLARLDYQGDTSFVADGLAAQSPKVKQIGIHYIELSYNENTPYKDGLVIFRSPETAIGGSVAINFDSLSFAGENEIVFQANINKIPDGTYNYLRVSIAYLNLEVDINLRNIPDSPDVKGKAVFGGILEELVYANNIPLENQSLDTNSNLSKGFFAVEPQFSAPYEMYNTVFSDIILTGFITVVNPIYATSPIPPGSAVITGKFPEPLIVNEELKQSNLIIRFTLSTNDSFVWIDAIPNGLWDLDALDPAGVEQLYDMGFRGLFPTFEVFE